MPRKDFCLENSVASTEISRYIESYPKVGASWEGFVIEQVIRQLGVETDECYFWATHSGAEVDLVVIRGRKRLGFEIKRTTTPKLTPSAKIAIKDLGLQRLDILHAGEHTFPLASKVRAVSVGRLLREIGPLY